MKRIVRIILISILGLLLVLALTGTALFYWNTNPELDPLIKQLAAMKKPGLERVIVCIDGVAWSYMHQLQAQGYFRIFRPASKMIVTFPAMTNVSLSDIWRTDVTPGYESLYFDRNSNTLGGGATTYVGSRKSQGRDFHTLLDYEEPRQYEFLVYVSPLRILFADMRRSILKLTQSDKHELRQYIKSSDGMIHMLGRPGASQFVKNLDAFLSAVYWANDGRTEIIVFSDHGNEFIPSQRVSLEAALEAAGYRLGSRLEGPRSVVIPAFGLVSFAALYAHEADRPGIAQVLADQTGVDFAAYQEGDTIYVQAADGVAELTWRPGGQSFRYEARGADPLRLQPAIDALRQNGKVDADDYITRQDWFEATAQTEYPDAPYRIWKGLNSQVGFPADLLVSFKAGYFYGSSTFDRFVKIQATHGSLRPDSSEAFLMSTHRDYPAATRGEDIIHYLGTKVAMETYFSLHPTGNCTHLPQ
jgi:hypothetical protein